VQLHVLHKQQVVKKIKFVFYRECTECNIDFWNYCVFRCSNLL
jgi:hypothetical protein